MLSDGELILVAGALLAAGWFLAAFAVTEGIPRSLEFFNIVFFAVLVSTLLQGATVGPLAQARGLNGELEPRH